MAADSPVPALPRSNNAEAGGEVLGFMCMIDWVDEIGTTHSKIYPSVKSLNADHGCAEACGIVEVEVRIRSVVTPGKQI